MESSKNEQESNEDEDECEEYEECEEEIEERERSEDNTNLFLNDLNFQFQYLMPNFNNNPSVIGGVLIGQQNTFSDNNSNTIYFLTEQFMNQRGWNLFDKDGNLIRSFTSLELFKHLTENILAYNIQLNNFVILNNIENTRYLGGELYLSIMNIIPLVLRKQQNEINQFLLLQMNNNGGTNLLNNNGNNFNTNNFNNNYFNQNNLNNNNMFNNNINNINNSNINNYNLNNNNEVNNNMNN